VRPGFDSRQGHGTERISFSSSRRPNLLWG